MNRYEIEKVNLCFLFALCCTDCFTDRTTCPLIYLQNGRVRYTNHGRIAKFKCNARYLLVGDESAVCANGQWSSSLHVCAKRDCPKLPKLYHGSVIYTNKKSIARPVCDTHFTLIGSPLLHCTESGWNDTLPSCIGADTEQFKPCHFEIGDPMHCHWLLSPSTYKWTVYPTMSSSDTSFDSQDDECPPYDHTLGPHPDGHYLLLIRNRSTPKSRKNTTDEARFISPLFPATDKMNESICLVFYYYTFSHAGMLKVIVNEDVVWANINPVFGEWTKQIISLQNQHQPFRIILTGFGESGYRSGLAIDDLSITKGVACNSDSVYEIPSAISAGLQTSATEPTGGIIILHSSISAELGSVESATNSISPDIYTTEANSSESTTNDVTTTDVSESSSNSEITPVIQETSSETISTTDNSVANFTLPEKITLPEKNRTLNASSSENKTSTVHPTIDTFPHHRQPGVVSFVQTPVKTAILVSKNTNIGSINAPEQHSPPIHHEYHDDPDEDYIDYEGSENLQPITDKTSSPGTHYYPYVICAALGTLFVILLVSWKLFDQRRIHQNDECSLLKISRSNTASSDMTGTFPLTLVKNSDKY